MATKLKLKIIKKKFKKDNTFKVTKFNYHDAIAKKRVELLGAVGIGYAEINAKTGVSFSGIYRILSKTGNLVNKYRTGKSQFAQKVIEASGQSSKQLVDQVRQKMLTMK